MVAESGFSSCCGCGCCPAADWSTDGDDDEEDDEDDS